MSNLVRTILEDALDVAGAASETVEVRLKRAADGLEAQRERLKKKMHEGPLDHVFAFQSITLAQRASCAKCRRDMEPGESAHLGLGDDPSPRARPARIFVCDACLPRR